MTSTSSYDAGLHQHETPRRVVVDLPARMVLRTVIVAALAVLLLYVVYLIRGFLVQLAIAAFIAVAVDPLVHRLQERGMSRGRAILVVMLGCIAALAVALSIFLPPLIDQADKLSGGGINEIVTSVQHTQSYQAVDKRFGVVDSLTTAAEKLPGIVSNQIVGVLAVVAAGVFGTITIMFLTVFLLTGGEQAMRGIARVVPQVTERRWWAIVHGAYQGISAYAGGAVVIALIGGSTMALVAALLGLPYALPLGLWMMLLEIIPMIGATIGAIPAVLVAFAAGGPIHGLAMVVFVIVYQQVENILIQPRVQGRAAQLSPLVVFASVIIGAKLLGVVGALFAVPVAGVIQIFVGQVIEQQGSHDVTLPGLHDEDETVTLEVVGPEGGVVDSTTGETIRADTTLDPVVEPIEVTDAALDGDDAGPSNSTGVAGTDA